MNKFNRKVINEFSDDENTAYLKYTLCDLYKDSRITAYLDSAFGTHVMNFIDQTEKYFMYTDHVDPQFVDDQNMIDQVACLNVEFLKHMTKLIDIDLLRKPRTEELKNNETYAVHDGLNATQSTLSAHMPRSRLDHGDTRIVDDEFARWTDPNWQSRAVSIDPTCESRNKRVNKQTLPATSRSADVELQRWYYPRRGAEVRDDPVGELNRDRNAPRARNQNEFPYGNAQAWEGRSDVYAVSTSDTCYGEPNPAESRGQHYSVPYKAAKMPNCGQKPTLPTCEQAVKNMREGMHSQPAYIGQKPSNERGNSLCAYEPGLVTIASDHSYDAHPDTYENGNYYGKFTEDYPEHSDEHVDRMMNTPYIQTLNQQYGEKTMRPDVLSSTYERGKHGAKQYCSLETRNNVKLWEDGDGFVDQSNPAAMKRLLDRRIWRSFNNPKGNSPHGVKHGDHASEQIPFYEKALYNRYHERDAEESVGGFELDYINRGYGSAMHNLYCKLPNKDPCRNDNKPLTGGYNHKQHVPWEFTTPF